MTPVVDGRRNMLRWEWSSSWDGSRFAVVLESSAEHLQCAASPLPVCGQYGLVTRSRINRASVTSSPLGPWCPSDRDLAVPGSRARCRGSVTSQPPPTTMWLTAGNVGVETTPRCVYVHATFNLLSSYSADKLCDLLPFMAGQSVFGHICCHTYKRTSSRLLVTFCRWESLISSFLENTAALLWKGINLSISVKSEPQGHRYIYIGAPRPGNNFGGTQQHFAPWYFGPHIMQFSSPGARPHFKSIQKFMKTTFEPWPKRGSSPKWPIMCWVGR